MHYTALFNRSVCIAQYCAVNGYYIALYFPVTVHCVARSSSIAALHCPTTVLVVQLLCNALHSPLKKKVLSCNALRALFNCYACPSTVWFSYCCCFLFVCFAQHYTGQSLWLAYHCIIQMDYAVHCFCSRPDVLCVAAYCSTCVRCIVPTTVQLPCTVMGNYCALHCALLLARLLCIALRSIVS